MRTAAYVAILFVVLAAGCISTGIQTDTDTSPPRTTSLELSFYIYQFDVTAVASKITNGKTLYHSFHVSVSANYIETGYWLDYTVVGNTTYSVTERTTSIERLSGLAVVIVSTPLLWFEPSEVDAWTYTIEGYCITFSKAYTFYVRSDGYRGSIVITKNYS